jgi:cytidylate kinase
MRCARERLGLTFRIVAASKLTKPRSARARGLRTLQHQTLPAETRQAIDTEVWVRALIVESEPAARRPARWSTKDQVHDEALAWFLSQYSARAYEHYPARRVGDEDLTFWVDSKLMARARRMASRDGVKVARLIDAALTAYVKARVPEELLNFRRRVQQEAARLYRFKSTGGAGRRGPKA